VPTCSYDYEVDATSIAPTDPSQIRFSLQYFRETVKSMNSFDA
jgi:hypothetical protein